MSLEPQRAGPKADSPEVAEPATGASTSAKSTDWRRNALTVLEALANSGVPFHVEDLLMLAGDPPSTKQLGGIFATASSNRLIEVVGATIAEGRLIEVVGATIAEGRLVRVWRGVPT